MDRIDIDALGGEMDEAARLASGAKPDMPWATRIRALPSTCLAQASPGGDYPVWIEPFIERLRAAAQQVLDDARKTLAEPKSPPSPWPPPPEINAGDIVEFRVPGSPVMRVMERPDPGRAICQWFTRDGGMARDMFYIHDLARVWGCYRCGEYSSYSGLPIRHRSWCDAPKGPKT